MIDWARVDELRNDMGSDGFDEVVELFLEEMDGRILTMQTGSNQTRAEDLHFLRGSAANIGFSRLHQVCSVAEHDEEFALDQVWSCYDQSKVEFLKVVRIDPAQINTPDSTSSSVMSR